MSASRGLLRLCWALVIGGGACGADRERPAPPQISITFNHDSAGPNDTLFYTLTATDPDQVDSMWVVVDSQKVRGYDALLLFTAVVHDTTHVRQGHIIGQLILVKYWARDANGWVDTALTYLTAKGL